MCYNMPVPFVVLEPDFLIGRRESGSLFVLWLNYSTFVPKEKIFLFVFFAAKAIFKLVHFKKGPLYLTILLLKVFAIDMLRQFRFLRRYNLMFVIYFEILRRSIRIFNAASNKCHIFCISR